MLRHSDTNSRCKNFDPVFLFPHPPIILELFVPQLFHMISVLLCMWEMESEGIYSVGFRFKQLSSHHQPTQIITPCVNPINLPKIIRFRAN